MVTKRILYLSFDGMTDPLGQSQVLPYLIGLASKGYNITLISAEKKTKFEDLSGDIKYLCETNSITWLPVVYHTFPPIICTLSDIRRILKLSEKMHKINPFDLVHCRSYLTGLIGYKLKKKLGIPFLFDMRGFWVDEKIDGKIWNLRNPVYRFIYLYMKKKEKELFRNADAIISLTNKACPIIHTISGSIQQQYLEVIPCCVDIDHFNPFSLDENEKMKWKIKLGIKEDEYILTYLGSLSTWYLPMEMIAFYKKLKEKIPSSRFLIISQEDPAPFKKTAAQFGIADTSLIFISSRRSDLPALLSISTVSLFFIKPSFSKIASSPTKLGELLSMGIPVICNSGIGDTDELILNSGTGVICNGFSEESFDDTIQQLSVLLFAHEHQLFGASEK